ncbi:glycosyltransferase [Streptomyces himalayensis]|uniref:Glycosyltransferase n=1 Tax=Streptomyces himalayensis subsp. himalayensis TaxID=2756131 RepID=A0A7W0I721_9ACTN|nr:glycosyltransferase [Streptomyces himalayensis]MBA2944541.1 glycosyltransferase [Streptomyces himalayensis subsp. himalayensis]
MTARSRTTVVVITRNRRDQLLHTLDRLAGLPERPPVIVTDNASTDGTADAVARLHPDVTVLRPERNLGALGRNVGVRHARTPYVAFSDDDSWWEPGALTAAERLLDSHPRLGLIAARVRVGPEGESDPLNEMLAGSPLGRAADLPGTQVLGFLACAAVARREAFLDAGGYHPVLFFAGEETCLAYDLAACGWGVCHCPDVVAVHRPIGGVRAGRPAVQRRNAVLTAWLRRPLPVALRHTRLLAAEARTDPEARKALREMFARLPAALRARRPLPAPVEAAACRLEGPGPTAPGLQGAVR